MPKVTNSTARMAMTSGADIAPASGATPIHWSRSRTSQRAECVPAPGFEHRFTGLHGPSAFPQHPSLSGDWHIGFERHVDAIPHQQLFSDEAARGLRKRVGDQTVERNPRIVLAAKAVAPVSLEAARVGAEPGLPDTRID